LPPEIPLFPTTIYWRQIIRFPDTGVPAPEQDLGAVLGTHAIPGSAWRMTGWPCVIRLQYTGIRLKRGKPGFGFTTVMVRLKGFMGRVARSAEYFLHGKSKSVV
jgi:hypothetical protein